MKMKFLIDDYTNNQTIKETKVNIVAYLPKANNKATKARCEISPMSTQYNPPQQHRYRLWAGKCQMVCKLLISK